MLHAFKIILAHPALRIAALTLCLTGMTGGATLPYLSIVGIQEFGLSDQWLSVLLFSIALANLVIGVSMSIVSDMVADRRPLLMMVSAAGIVGFGLIYLVPQLLVFVLCAVLLVPFSNSGFSLLFATIRALSSRVAAGKETAINTVVRAMFSGAWMIVPGVVGFFLAGAPSMLGAWGFSALVCLACLLLVLFLLPPLPAAEGHGQARVPFFASLRQATTGPILARVTAMALITAATRLISVIQPLILTGMEGGSVVDVGLIAGGCAALEIPFMLIWGSLLKRISVLTALTIGTAIYAGFMLLLSLATAPWQVYALLIPNAFGVSALLVLPLSYFQDLLSDRPGLGTALNQMMSFISNGLSALGFALGAHFLGYSGTALIGMAMAALGIAMLLTIETRPGDNIMASADHH